MGVLVGTSLIVIIPEGVETLYSANLAEHTHARRSLRDPLHVRWNSQAMYTPIYVAQSASRRNSKELDAFKAPPGPVIPDGLISGSHNAADPPKTPTAPGEFHISEGTDTEGSKATSHEEEKIDAPPHTPHAWVGISLILGFILMYLIDTLPSLKPPPPPQRMNIYSLSDLGSASPPHSASSLPKGTFSTTLGLVIHAAADGIALGASSSQPSLSFIIFLAIMVHKAPAAFGLTSVLLKQGLGKRAARAHLVAFSLAAPLGALVTWIIVRLLGGGGGGEGPGSEDSMRWWTGVLLLFSGGTFL